MREIPCENRAFSLNGKSIQLSSKNPNRVMLIIQNRGKQHMFIRFGAEATMDNESLLLRVGCSLILDSPCPTNAIFANGNTIGFFAEATLRNS